MEIRTINIKDAFLIPPAKAALKSKDFMVNLILSKYSSSEFSREGNRYMSLPGKPILRGLPTLRSYVGIEGIYVKNDRHYSSREIHKAIQEDSESKILANIVRARLPVEKKALLDDSVNDGTRTIAHRLSTYYIPYLDDTIEPLIKDLVNTILEEPKDLSSKEEVLKLCIDFLRDSTLIVNENFVFGVMTYRSPYYETSFDLKFLPKSVEGSRRTFDFIVPKPEDISYSIVYSLFRQCKEEMKDISYPLAITQQQVLLPFVIDLTTLELTISQKVTQDFYHIVNTAYEQSDNLRGELLQAFEMSLRLKDNLNEQEEIIKIFSEEAKKYSLPFSIEKLIPVTVGYNPTKIIFEGGRASTRETMTYSGNAYSAVIYYKKIPLTRRLGGAILVALENKEVRMVVSSWCERVTRWSREHGVDQTYSQFKLIDWLMGRGYEKINYVVRIPELEPIEQKPLSSRKEAVLAKIVGNN